MSSRQGREPSVKLLAAKLWEKTSASGNRYLVGRLGGVRILILGNHDRGTEGEADFHLFFVDGSPREDPHAEPPATAARPRREPRRRAPYPDQREVRPPIRPDSVLPDDDISDVGGRGP